MRHLDFYCGSLTVMRILTAVYPGAESLRARANQSPMQYFEIFGIPSTVQVILGAPKRRVCGETRCVQTPLDRITQSSCSFASFRRQVLI